jgi:uncharacterized protein YbbC (DUF1343 family)
VHVTDRTRFAPVKAGIAILLDVVRHHGNDFSFLPGNSPFFDRLAGVAWLRDAVATGDNLDAIEARWQPGLASFMAQRARCLLY